MGGSTLRLCYSRIPAPEDFGNHVNSGGAIEIARATVSTICNGLALSWLQLNQKATQICWLATVAQLQVVGFSTSSSWLPGYVHGY